MAKFARSLLIAGLLLVPGTVLAQTQVGVDREMASRAELQASLGTAQGDARAAIQQRLTDGDFQPGDLIALSVLEESTLTDTFTVRSGRTLQLPNLPEISLRGVLRSELRPFLAGKVAEHIRNPQVDAVALIRVAVMGAVNRPGFYNVPAETPAAEVVMTSSGFFSTSIGGAAAGGGKSSCLTCVSRVRASVPLNSSSRCLRYSSPKPTWLASGIFSGNSSGWRAQV